MNYQHLSPEERVEIAVLKDKGYSLRSIAKAMKRSHSSLSRELKRNEVSGTYEATKAQHKAYVSRKYSKYQGMKVADHSELEKYIQEKLKKHWTPEQIAGRLRDEASLPYVSRTGIYKYLYSSYGQKYCEYLPSKRYRPKRRKEKKAEREMIPNRVGIEERPEEVNGKEVFGHYEADTVVSKRNTGKAALCVLEERLTRKICIKRIPSMRPEKNNKALKQMSKNLPIKTLTLDNGIENKHHEKLSKKLKISIFFCNPYSSWEKGAVENTNGRIRRFFPKGTDFSKVHPASIAKVQRILNNTPRKCLNYKTPNEMFAYYSNLPINPNTPSGALQG